jgi:hypothetical protein
MLKHTIFLQKLDSIWSNGPVKRDKFQISVYETDEVRDCISDFVSVWQFLSIVSHNSSIEPAKFRIFNISTILMQIPQQLGPLST